MSSKMVVLVVRKYACFAFISDCRFETGEKRYRLAYLTLDDFIYCAHEMMQNWTYGMQAQVQAGEPGIDLDRQFLRSLADLKGELSDKDILEQYRMFVDFFHSLCSHCFSFSVH
eukprot:m.197110 g.197110  ORF g.197110 m.197110 type:complete len:114 (+) comp39538_c0_seq36:795-1136(+)